jgi:hypothetical protein
MALIDVTKVDSIGGLKFPDKSSRKFSPLLPSLPDSKADFPNEFACPIWSK